MRRPTRWALIAVFCALAGCGRSVRLDIKLVTDACTADSKLDPLLGATQLRFTVYGEGIEPAPLTVPLSRQLADLPDIAPGPDRNIVVEALDGEGVVSRGETGPIDITTSADVVSLAVFLRRTDAFTPAAARDATTSCSVLARPRAGHTATLLDDGRVLVAGGYSEDSGGNRVYEASTEIYDPRTGQFTPGPDLKIKRAFHSATAIPGARKTLIAGGRFDGDAGRAVRLAEVFDEETNTFSAVGMLEGRVGHGAAASVTAGAVVLAGGFDGDGVPLKTTEIWNAKKSAFEPGPKLPAPRADLTALALAGGGLFLAGGYDGAALVRRAEVLVPLEGGIDLAPDVDIVMPVSRIAPMLAAFDARTVVLAGGFNDREDERTYRSASDLVEVVNLDTRSAERATASLARRRADGGALSLPDGTILVGGGGQQDNGRTVSLSEAEILAPADHPPGPSITVRPVRGPLRDGRFQAAWTLLRDGTVLVTGGVNVSSGRRTVLESAELYQPKYQTSGQNAYR